jgi:hypothetical protein
MSVADFTKLLKDKKYPKSKEGWDIEGILHKSTNRSYKYDLSPIRKFEDESVGKIGFFKTKADKMVFDFKDQWIILDIEELHEYIKENNVKNLLLDDLLKTLTWNIIVDK